MATKGEYPMWHRRFVASRNNLSVACMEMEQAAFEDKDNPKFKALLKRMRDLRDKVDTQGGRNFKRGQKEGWL